jgi:hypothetical protein
MKRLEEIESEFLALGDDVDGYEVERSRFWWLLRLTRALLESQGELLERVGNEECNCEVAKGKTAWECPRCKVLARAERIRKGEV